MKPWLARRMESARSALKAMPIWKQRAMAARFRQGA